MYSIIGYYGNLSRDLAEEHQSDSAKGRQKKRGTTATNKKEQASRKKGLKAGGRVLVTAECHMTVPLCHMIRKATSREEDTVKEETEPTDEWSAGDEYVCRRSSLIHWACF